MESLDISDIEDNASESSFKKQQKAKDSKRETIFRRKQTLKDQRSYIDKYVDIFWAHHIEGRDMSIGEIDLAVHKLIH